MTTDSPARATNTLDPDAGADTNGSADASPTAHLRLAFADEAEAQRFETEWPAIVKRWRAATLLLGLASLLDGLTARREGAVLDIAGRISETQTALALAWARALIPRPAETAAPADGGAADPRDGGVPRAAHFPHSPVDSGAHSSRVLAPRREGASDGR